MFNFLKYLQTIFLATTFLACGGSNTTNNHVKEGEQNKTKATWYTPDKNTTWQWQLTGKINQNYNVDVYDIDLREPLKTLDTHNITSCILGEALTRRTSRS